MKVQINVSESERPDLAREMVESEIDKALGRFKDRITRVEVHLRDINGPKEGVDQRCSIEVRLAGYDPLAVDADAADITTAVREAAGKARRAVERKIDRRESHR